MTRNPYLPHPARVEDVTVENGPGTSRPSGSPSRTRRAPRRFSTCPASSPNFPARGRGRRPSESPPRPRRAGISILGQAGRAFHLGAPQLEAGPPSASAGRLGKPFPWDRLAGKDIVIIGGGFAFTTLARPINYVLDPANRQRFGALRWSTARAPRANSCTRTNWRVAGAGRHRGPPDRGQGRRGLDATQGRRDDGARGVEAPRREHLAVVCGPPVMIRFALLSLGKLGFADDAIILSLEMRMKCGIGKCGRCNIGSKYVCKDGPVFTREELKALPLEDLAQLAQFRGF